VPGMSFPASRKGLPMSYHHVFPAYRGVLAFAHRLRQPEALALLPAAMLAAFWTLGEGALVLAALVLPAVMVLADRWLAWGGRSGAGAVPVKQMALTRILDAHVQSAMRAGRTTICYVLRLDDADTLAARLGKEGMAQALQLISDRLGGALRDGDLVARYGANDFVVLLKPVLRADLESALQIAARMQAAAEAPLSIAARTVHVTLSAGFCLASRAPAPGGLALLDAAGLALADAQRNGAGTIRAFTAGMLAPQIPQPDLAVALELALERREISAHFQPQISTDTGQITGFEALVRWQRPDGTLVAPADFLPALFSAGLSGRLSEVMLTQSLSALRDWDRAGMMVPMVSVNFSREELSDPQLIDRLKWELDRYNLSPDRLTAEVHESLAADAGDDEGSDVVLRNIAALAAMGCGIDLDDFGTGQAPISGIRKLAIKRIKIDRNFVKGVDHDPNQQKLVSAILTMAETLGIDALAEGVETRAEHAMLAQLGCRHVQGFGIGSPMPAQAVSAWVGHWQDCLPASASLRQRRMR